MKWLTDLIGPKAEDVRIVNAEDERISPKPSASS